VSAGAGDDFWILLDRLGKGEEDSGSYASLPTLANKHRDEPLQSSSALQPDVLASMSFVSGQQDPKKHIPSPVINKKFDSRSPMK
jgi:hypothetical protein